MTTYFHQNGAGADGSMAGAFFANQGISLTSVNPVLSNTGNSPSVTPTISPTQP